MADVEPNIAESVLEAAGVGGWDLDVRTGRLSWTAVTFRIHEIDPAGQPRLEGALDFYPPEARPVIAAAVQAGISAGTAWDLELPFVTARGKRLWVRACGRAIREDGRTVRLIGAFQDITSRRAAEEEARRESAERQRAEALLRDVLDTLPNAVTAYDSQERYILCNRAYDRLFPAWAKFAVPGRTREEVLRLAAEHGQFADSGSTPEEKAAWVAKHLAFHRNPGGARAIVLANGRVMEAVDRRSDSGNVVTVRTDTTDLKHAEALLRDVLDALPSGVTAFDADERLILTNRAYAEMFPISARFATPGRRLEEMLRLSAEHGQYADRAATAEEREAWVAEHLAYFRNPGAARTLRLANGRFVQVSERRSDTGYLVTVRTDATDLKRAESLLRDVLEAIPSAVVAYGPDEHLVLTNQAYRDMFPISTRFATPGQRLEDLVRLGAEAGQYADVPTDDAGREAWIGAQLAHHRSPGQPRAMRLNDGRLMQVVERRSEDGNLVSVRTDTTELHRAEALLRDVLDAIPNAVVAYDAQERLTVWNRAAVDLMPVSARFVRQGIRLEDMVRLSVANGQFPEAGESPAEREAWVARQLAFYRGAGGPRTVRLPNGRFAQAREQRSENGHLVCVRTDTTELMRAQADLRQQAECDPLTLLANRPTFLAALEQALTTQVEGRRPGGALLLLDIDYFKQINDTLGHDMGDALLIEIANRLRGLLRIDDIAARLGGDEYGVLIPGLNEPNAVAARMDAVHAALSAPVDLGGRRQLIGITIGVTLFPADGTQATNLLKNADLALYEAKRNGRGRWGAFRPEQAEALHRHVRIADALRRAIAQDGVTVSLQPKRLLRGGHAGFEALARWHDGTRWVPPADFIPVAEDTGLIVPLGRAVMEASLARIRALRDQGVMPGRVAVNVTGPQLLDSHFIAETLDTLARHGLCPADLELELTETVLFGRAAERIEAVLREFSGMGITLALDDFGTGYASLAHLSRLPIDRLKIDQSFVAGIGKGGPGGVIARTVVSLAHSLGMESIAEGVETAEQLAFLDAAGCDAGQGYLFSRPLLTVAEALDYLRAEARAAARPAAASSVSGVVPAGAGCQ